MDGATLSADRTTATAAARCRSDRLKVAGALAIPAVVYLILALLRLHNGAGGIDLSVYDQALWRAAHGHSGVSTVVNDSLLGDHFSPGVLVFVLLYRVIATPVWLVISQVVAVWAAVALLVCRLTRLSLRRRILVGSALLLSPPIAFGMLTDPHTTVMAIPFALAAILALEDDRPGRALLLGLLATAFRTEVGLGVLVAFATVPRGVHRRWPSALGLLAYVGLSVQLEQVLGHGGGQWSTYYGYLGASPLAALAHPERVLGALLTPKALSQVFFWVAAGGFLAFSRPRRALPALAVALPVLLSHWVGSHQWGLHYDITPTLFLVAAGLPALEVRPGLTRHLLVGCVALSLVAGPFTPTPIVTPGTTALVRFVHPDTGLLCLAAGVPVQAGVSAPAGDLATLAHRDVLYAWPFPFYAPDDSTPSVYEIKAQPDLAAGVDVIIRPPGDPYSVPSGYVLDARARGYERLRKATSAPLPDPSCSRS